VSTLTWEPRVVNDERSDQHRPGWTRPSSLVEFQLCTPLPRSRNLGFALLTKRLFSRHHMSAALKLPRQSYLPKTISAAEFSAGVVGATDRRRRRGCLSMGGYGGGGGAPRAGVVFTEAICENRAGLGEGVLGSVIVTFVL